MPDTFQETEPMQPEQILNSQIFKVNFFDSFPKKSNKKVYRLLRRAKK